MTGTSELSRSGWGFRLPIAPVVASRPRVSRWGTYYAKKYQQYRMDMKRLLDGFVDPKMTPEPTEFVVEFVCTRPKNPTNIYPIGDLNNYTKAIEDAINGKLGFKDDKQIVASAQYKRYAEIGEEPHTIVIVGDLNISNDVMDMRDTISIEEIRDE